MFKFLRKFDATHLYRLIKRHRTFKLGACDSSEVSQFLSTETDSLTQVSQFLSTETDSLTQVSQFLSTETDSLTQISQFLSTETDSLTQVLQVVGYISSTNVSAVLVNVKILKS